MEECERRRSPRARFARDAARARIGVALDDRPGTCRAIRRADGEARAARVRDTVAILRKRAAVRMTRRRAFRAPILRSRPRSRLRGSATYAGSHACPDLDCDRLRPTSVAAIATCPLRPMRPPSNSIRTAPAHIAPGLGPNDRKAAWRRYRCRRNRMSRIARGPASPVIRAAARRSSRTAGRSAPTRRAARGMRRMRAASAMRRIARRTSRLRR